jgi:hypothetical protein
VDFELIRLNQLVLVSSKTQQNFLLQGRTGNDWIARESASFRRQRRIQKRQADVASCKGMTATPPRKINAVSG